MFSILDDFLTPGSTLHRFSDVGYLARGHTDHSPLMMALSSDRQKFRAEWRMDTWRLQNKKEIDRLDEVTKLYLAENTGTVTSAGILWEAHKATIRGEIMAGESGDRSKRQEQIAQI